MASETPDMQAVMERLEKLEKQNRWLKWGGLIVALVVMVWVATWEARQRRSVEAKEFVLRDAQGRMRVRLAVNGDFTDMSLYGEDMLKGSARLTASQHGGQVELGAPGKAFATLDVTDSVGSGLHLHHENSWAGVLAAPDGSNLTLSTPDVQTGKSVIMQTRTAYPVAKGAGSATLGVDRDGPYLNIQDKENFQAMLGSTSLVVPTTGETRTTSAASLVMFGKDGKMRWRAP